jgi:hypothetical protein
MKKPSPTRGSSRLGEAAAKINLKFVSVIPGKVVVATVWPGD